MIGRPTTIVGFPLPSDAPLFLALIAVLTAVIAGAIAEKRPGRHPKAGTVYYWALAVVFVTMSALAFSRWSEDYHLFILGFLVCRRDDRPEGEAKTLAVLGAHSHDRNGRVLDPDDYSLFMWTTGQTCRCGGNCLPWPFGFCQRS